jgi:stage IV sporulation protein FB
VRGIPIKIAPTFFLTAALIGFINSFSILGTAIWVGIIFISVLVHEFGHAVMSLLFGQHPRIELVAFGGLTIPEGKRLSRWKEFIVVLMGPLFGFLLFVIATLILQIPFENTFARAVLQTIRFVNLFWTAVNLFPILPLDGGQLVRIVLEGIFGSKGWKISLYVSLAFSSVVSVAFFMIGYFLVGAVFLIFAFQGIETIRKFGTYSEADQEESNQMAMREVENLLRMGRAEEAIVKLEALRMHTGKGLIYTLASEYLAKIHADHEDYTSAYKILSDLEKTISKEAKCILQKAAYSVGDYKKAIRLSGICFQEKQTIEVALRAAHANAMEKNIQETIEWLKTAASFGSFSIQEMIKDAAFDSIRSDSTFQKFINRI